MLDLIGAIAGTAVYAIIVGVLVGLSPADRTQKWALYVAATAWGMLIVSIAARGGFVPGAAGPIPGPVFAFAGLLVLLFGAWLLSAPFRNALLAVPLPALVALNITRVVGVLFLLLEAEGRLSAPFAPSAGWGDILTGLFAIPLALVAAGSNIRRAGAALALWNVFGTLDLIAAIMLGALSAPGSPLRIFTDGAGTLAMGELPWLMVPAMLVPIYLLMHLTIATRLRSSHRLAGAALAAA
jgi:hypothetical protein